MVHCKVLLCLPFLVFNLKLVSTSLVATIPMVKLLNAASCFHELTNTSSSISISFLNFLCVCFTKLGWFYSEQPHIVHSATVAHRGKKLLKVYETMHQGNDGVGGKQLF